MSAKAKLITVMGATAAATAISVTGMNEGLSLTPYWDAIARVTTYCYGETDAKGLKPQFTQAECQEKLAQGLLDRYLQIRKCAPVMDRRTPGEKAAYLDLAYNVGAGTFCGGSIPRLLAAGAYREACRKTEEYTYSRGTFIQGLLNRRVRVYDVCVRDMETP